MQSETGFPSSHQLKSYVASKSRLKLAARAVLSADAGLLVLFGTMLKVESLEKRLGLGLARSRVSVSYRDKNQRSPSRFARGIAPKVSFTFLTVPSKHANTITYKYC